MDGRLLEVREQHTLLEPRNQRLGDGLADGVNLARVATLEKVRIWLVLGWFCAGLTGTHTRHPDTDVNVGELVKSFASTRQHKPPI